MRITHVDHAIHAFEYPDDGQRERGASSLRIAIGVFASAVVARSWRSVCIGGGRHIAAIFERI